MKRALLRGSAVGRVVFSFSAEVPEGREVSAVKEESRYLGMGLKWGVKRYNEDHGWFKVDDTSDPAEPPDQATTLPAETRTSKSSSQRPLRLAS